jgi:hypothetical protein
MIRLTTNLAATALAGFWAVFREWAAFLACLLCTATGVGLNFFVFGAELAGTRGWVLAVIIALVMMSVSYGAKYGDTANRANFTPLDVIQYTAQGFLWSASWPTFAHVLGIQPVTPPSLMMPGLPDVIDSARHAMDSVA